MRVHSAIAALLSLALLIGCNGSRNYSPTAPPAPQVVITTDATGIWLGDATVVSSTGGLGCGWGLTPGETRSGVVWQIDQAGNSLTFDEDMNNYPTDSTHFKGSLNGSSFLATDVERVDKSVCQFRGGDLSGTFSEDRRHFEATENLTWGLPGHDLRVQRHWVGRQP